MKNTFDVNQRFITAGRLVSKQITLDDFLTYDQDYCIENINYSKKIYRITDKSMFGDIEKHLREEFLLNHMYQFDNVKKTQMFYIENFDLQSIDEQFDDIKKMINDDGYEIINIIRR